MECFNEKVERIRKKHKLSRAGLSNISGFNARTIASYERGERIVSPEYLLFLSLYFNVELEYFKNDNYKENGMKDNLLLIERYKYIYQYNNHQMIEKLNCKDENEYIESLNLNGTNLKSLSFLITISNKLNIKPSSLGFNIIEDRIIFRNKIISPNPIYYDIDLKVLIKNENNDDFISITNESFLEVVRKRNDPSTVFIPSTQDEKINKEFHEVLELLNYAPKDFVAKLLIQLKKFKTEQENFFE